MRHVAWVVPTAPGVKKIGWIRPGQPTNTRKIDETCTVKVHVWSLNTSTSAKLRKYQTQVGIELELTPLPIHTTTAMNSKLARPNAQKSGNSWTISCGGPRWFLLIEMLPAGSGAKVAPTGSYCWKHFNVQSSRQYIMAVFDGSANSAFGCVCSTFLSEVW